MNTKNKIEKNKTSKQGKVWPVVLCLLLAAGIFLLLLNVEKRQMAQFEKGGDYRKESDSFVCCRGKTINGYPSRCIFGGRGFAGTVCAERH